MNKDMFQPHRSSSFEFVPKSHTEKPEKPKTGSERATQTGKMYLGEIPDGKLGTRSFPTHPGIDEITGPKRHA